MHHIILYQPPINSKEEEEDMATCASLHVQMASILEVLTKAALAEMTKLVDDASAELRLEMFRSQIENEALKCKLLVMEGELTAARGCGEGTAGRSLNIAFEVEVCDEFREAQNSKVGGEGSVVAVERVFDERLSTGPVKDEQYVGLPVEKKKTDPDALDIKCEPVDGEQDWSESVFLSEDWLEEDPKMSQSQLERMISEEDSRGTSGAVAANGGEGPLCEEEEEEEEELYVQPCPTGDPAKGLLAELKQEPDEEPLTPGHSLPGSAEGLEVRCAWSKAISSGKVWEMLRHHRGGAQSNNRFSPRHFRDSQRLCLEKNEGPTSHLELQKNGRPRGLPDDISTEMAFPLGFRGECAGSALYEESFDAEAESRRRIEGQEQFVYTRCRKTFPDTFELQTRHQRVHAGEKCLLCKLCGKLFDGADSLKQHSLSYHGAKQFRCTLCGKGFTAKSSLKTHQSVHTGEKPHSCDKCGKRFAQLCHLKSHQRLHTGEKPHSCNECGKSFALLGTLKTHQRVHTGEKPHSCTLCGKSFSQNHNLQKHILTHSL